MILSIAIAHRPVGQSSFSKLFEADNFELDLITQKIDKSIELLGDAAEILVEKLSLNTVHVARCCDVKNLGDLKTLILSIHDFASGDFIRLNRAIGAFDNSTVKADELTSQVDVIAPVAYDVKDNYKENGDIREKDKYSYVEVGRGILIGIPK